MQGMVTIVITQEEEGGEVDVKTFFAPRLELEGDNSAAHATAVRMLEAVMPDKV